MNKKINKYPSKKFWILYIICFTILFYIGLKNGAELNFTYIVITLIINFIITIAVVLLYFFIKEILGDTK